MRCGSGVAQKQDEAANDDKLFYMLPSHDFSSQNWHLVLHLKYKGKSHSLGVSIMGLMLIHMVGTAIVSPGGLPKGRQI